VALTIPTPDADAGAGTAGSESRPAEPTVSVAVPMLNEGRHIIPCLRSFAAQTWPKHKLDVMVIDGGSEDGSELLVEAFAAQNPWVRIVPNPLGSAAAAFNVGMNQARGEVVCLFSAHGVADPDYVQRSVEALHRSGYRHEGIDPTSTAIGLAMTSPVGMASPHRFATGAQDVDTISHPAYWRDAMLAVGGFDENLARNSDYEFNYRMRVAAHRLHFDPAIGSVYRPRASLNALFRQFWYYGKWKARVVEQHPGSISPRHVAAPLAVLGALTTPVLFLLKPLRPLRSMAVVGWSAYLALIGYGVKKAEPRRHRASVVKLAAAFPTMHSAWGSGFLKSVLDRITGAGR
jgi:succinoglycan biosynthesis protein ExoA